MSDTTGISWTDATWNPVRGCSRVSEGCRNCYAEVQAARIVRMGKGKPTPYDGLVKLTAAGEPRWTGEVRLVPEQLAWPLRKKKPLRIFVNSMSDLFHESLTNEQIAAVFGVMAACPQHTFQVLTKRARRMREWCAWVNPLGRRMLDRIGNGGMPPLPRKLIEDAAIGTLNGVVETIPTWRANMWPLPNVWLGTSVENQPAADKRIPDLLATPAAVRFLSCEPLLGPIDLDPPLCNGFDRHGDAGYCVADDDATPWCLECDSERSYGHWLHLDGGIDWVIAGCESGPGARPCEVAWLRSLRDQCAEAGTAFFLKQAVPAPGSLAVDAPMPAPIAPGEGSKWKPGAVIELPYLDGVQHAAFPEVPHG